MTDSRVRVETGGRLHLGFRNLAPNNGRLFGGIALALEQPHTVVEARQAETLSCSHDRARKYARATTDLLDVNGARVSIPEALPAHVGFGSGTQLALGTATAIGHAYDQHPAVRETAPSLGRGQRSGAGCGCFQHGGLVLDAGHERASTRRETSRAVPPIAAREPVPNAWRFLLVLPDVSPGRSGPREDRSLDRATAEADPSLERAIERAIGDSLLPGIRDQDVERFGRGVRRIDRLTGAWFAGEQAGRHRKPCGQLIETLEAEDAVHGAGQSSWGPLVYGVTTADRATAARTAGKHALREAGLTGTVRVVSARNDGARINPSHVHTDRIPARNQ